MADDDVVPIRPETQSAVAPLNLLDEEMNFVEMYGQVAPGFGRGNEGAYAGIRKARADAVIGTYLSRLTCG
jgi:hypothetical protein